MLCSLLVAVAILLGEQRRIARGGAGAGADGAGVVDVSGVWGGMKPVRALVHVYDCISLLWWPYGGGVSHITPQPT